MSAQSQNYTLDDFIADESVCASCGVDPDSPWDIPVDSAVGRCLSLESDGEVCDECFQEQASVYQVGADVEVTMVEHRYEEAVYPDDAEKSDKVDTANSESSEHAIEIPDYVDVNWFTKDLIDIEYNDTTYSLYENESGTREGEGNWWVRNLSESAIYRYDTEEEAFNKLCVITPFDMDFDLYTRGDER